MMAKIAKPEAGPDYITARDVLTALTLVLGWVVPAALTFVVTHH